MNVVTLNFVKTDLEDLSCKTGVSFIIDLRITEQCTNLPDDLTGYSAVLKIFDENENVIIDTITGSITEPEKGIVSFNIPAYQTETYPVGMYYHHIELTIDTAVYRIGEGYFEVLQ